jgi:hypothetical protein
MTMAPIAAAAPRAVLSSSSTVRPRACGTLLARLLSRPRHLGVLLFLLAR